jgi:hypothetical protein
MAPAVPDTRPWVPSQSELARLVKKTCIVIAFPAIWLLSKLDFCCGARVQGPSVRVVVAGGHMRT